MQTMGRAERLAYAASFEICYSFRLLYYAGTQYPIMGALRLGHYSPKCPLNDFRHHRLLVPALTNYFYLKTTHLYLPLISVWLDSYSGMWFFISLFSLLNNKMELVYHVLKVWLDLSQHGSNEMKTAICKHVWKIQA